MHRSRRQENGVSDLQSLTAVHIRDFVSSLEGYRPGSLAVHASTLRSFLTYLHFKGTLIQDLSYAVERPRLYRWSQPPEVLNSETIERLLRSIDRTTAMGKRDYAILLLAARYGLRASDIRKLRFENIVWRDDRIILLQSKTQRPLELPLRVDVAAALVDYIRHGRPTCTAREIFVRHLPPIGPFTHDIAAAFKRALKSAHIDLVHHCGLQLLRHSLATQMLADGVALDTISDVLGHCSVETTRRYTQVDLTRLRDVAMPETEVRR
jgi:site-specific recombinase XerD